jgi:hypothetical protein
MAQANNNFLKSRMNKDLDARILPKGEYRNAVNIQVSRSEGESVGALENILGNELLTTLQPSSKAIGYFANEQSSTIYIFVTDYLDQNPDQPTYNPTKTHGIYSYNTLTSQSALLVSGAFLNFSQSNPIYGVNCLEDLLFWTDNRNQPRKINTTTASEIPGYYTKEEQISVAKNFPYQAIELWQESQLGTSVTETEYETTMYDVSSKFYPDGGEALTNGAVTASTSIIIDNISGSIPVGSVVSGPGVVAGTTVVSFNLSTNTLEVSQQQTLINNSELVFNANPYYESTFNGDPSYLEDRFVRFSYRFRYDDGEYSVFAPFTQTTFIPKQDGYFMQKTPAATGVEEQDEEAAYRTTIVEFVENKVDKILLRIPLEYANTSIQDNLKITEVDILYKESDQAAVKVVDTIPAKSIYEQSGTCSVVGNPTATTSIIVNNIVGGIKVGSIITGESIVEGTTVQAFDQDTSTITTSVAQTLTASTVLTIGEPDFYIYEYQSKKPFKTLPEKELIRVYDKIPVKAFSQEVVSNRIVYGNYQNKHTPPSSLDYNVNASEKANFNLKTGTLDVNGDFTNVNTIVYTNVTGDIFTGSFVSSEAIGSIIPAGTVVVSFDAGTLSMTFSNNVTLSNGDLLNFTPSSKTEYNTSKIEYPNHSLKENRNYQVGIVLSDKFGRQSSVILSSSLASAIVDGQEYIGSTIYSAYRTAGVNPAEWAGDSLKVLFNSPIHPVAPNYATGWPGIYNGESTSANYNPLGWYSYKIVVKQTEQDYYNVYLPGVMAAYPEQNTLEIGKTSHTVLFNDNINKVPRDLNEVGPLQRLFRSSVELFGRVENLDSTIGTGDINTQYYPGRVSDVVSSIANMNDLFGLDPLSVGYPVAGYKEFYLYESNPLIGRISTTSKFGVASTVTRATVDGVVTANVDIIIDNLSGPDPQPGDIVSGSGILAETSVVSYNAGLSTVTVNQAQTLADDTLLLFSPQVAPITIQNLAVLETVPVESLLDIFWETSTSGLVSELNTSILDQSLGGSSLEGWTTPNFTESAVVGTVINGAPFYLANSFGSQIAQADILDFSILSIFDNNSIDRSNDFEIDYSLNNGTYQIKTKSLFWFGVDAAPRNFTFTFLAQTTDGTVSQFVETASLINITPTVTTCPDGQTLVVDIEDTFITQIQGENGSAYFEASGQNPAVKNLAGQDLVWEMIQYNVTDPATPLEFGPFTATPIVPAEGTDNIASLNITKDTTSAGEYIIEIILKDAQGEAGAGSLSTIASSCTFNVEIQTPCEEGRQWQYKTGSKPGNLIDATANFTSLVSGSYSNADQVFLIDTLDFYNATANIWSYCSQQADGNIQAGDLNKAGVYKGSRVQVYQNGVWSEYAQVQYYKPGGGNTAEIKIRPSSYVGGNPQTGIDWSTVTAGTPIRFYTGKDLLRWTNQFGTQCGGIYNFNTLVGMVGNPVSPPNDSSLNISSNFADGGICSAQQFTQCLTPSCPVQIGDGTYPYTPTSFQPYPGGGGNSCGSTIGSITCT